MPVKNLRLGGNLGLLDTEFTEFQVLNGGPDYSGNEFVRSPHVTALVYADYRILLPVGNQPSLILGADWHYWSHQFHFTTNQDDPLLGADAFSILNARVSYESNDEKLLLTAYVNNATDTKYRAHTLPGTSGSTGNAVSWGDPVSVGGSAHPALVLKLSSARFFRPGSRVRAWAWAPELPAVRRCRCSRARHPLPGCYWCRDVVKSLVVFDLDGTLAESKSALDAEMGSLLEELLDVVKVAVISGGDWPQFESQLLRGLPAGVSARQPVFAPVSRHLSSTRTGRVSRLYSDAFSDVREGADHRCGLTR